MGKITLKSLLGGTPQAPTKIPPADKAALHTPGSIEGQDEASSPNLRESFQRLFGYTKHSPFYQGAKSDVLLEKFKPSDPSIELLLKYIRKALGYTGSKEHMIRYGGEASYGNTGEGFYIAFDLLDKWKPQDKYAVALAVQKANEKGGVQFKLHDFNDSELDDDRTWPAAAMFIESSEK